MPTNKNTLRKHIWNEVREDRERYFVIYSPINRNYEKFACLHLNFVTSTTAEQVVRLMEDEIELWFFRYPLPIMVFAYDESGNSYLLENTRTSDQLTGFIDSNTNKLVKSWNTISNEYLIEIEDDLLKKIYQGIPYQTIEQKISESRKDIKDRQSIKKVLDTSLFIWILSLVMISYLGWQNFWIGTVAFIYSLYRIMRIIFNIKGFKTNQQIVNDEKKRKMSHYYYHCELNPEGFLNLKGKNLRNREIERIKKQKMIIMNSDKNS